MRRFHQTIIVTIGRWLTGTAFSPAAMFAIFAAATLAGCALFHLAGSRIAWLRPFIGLAPVAPQRAPSLQPAAGPA